MKEMEQANIYFIISNSSGLKIFVLSKVFTYFILFDFTKPSEVIVQGSELVCSSCYISLLGKQLLINC